MNLGIGMYGFFALDAEGFELNEGVSDRLSDAKRRARELVKDKELIAAGMIKVEVRNYKDECLADFFVPDITYKMPVTSGYVYEWNPGENEWDTEVYQDNGAAIFVRLITIDCARCALFLCSDGKTRAVVEVSCVKG